MAEGSSSPCNGVDQRPRTVSVALTQGGRVYAIPLETEPSDSTYATARTTIDRNDGPEYAEMGDTYTAGVYEAIARGGGATPRPCALDDDKYVISDQVHQANIVPGYYEMPGDRPNRPSEPLGQGVAAGAGPIDLDDGNCVAGISERHPNDDGSDPKFNETPLAGNTTARSGYYEAAAVALNPTYAESTTKLPTTMANAAPSYSTNGDYVTFNDEGAAQNPLNSEDYIVVP